MAMRAGIVPIGTEGHRYELFPLVAWIGLFWGSYDPTRPNFDGFVQNWVLPGNTFAQLGRSLVLLCESIYVLARNHIDEHGIHAGNRKSGGT
ncbi:hypothetical protein N7471_008678 [Penicillium samsonianum]|uniref:uncharacterized protein n=1 Tax=Penicillium samsonianum TaxID=1882272 RepID=UPI0025466A24|nr:uncharacterized protein N7471_008678 [Penicillium samsonianum]KAJ6133463.1 hypothetical protein N7471_008678 [Penicillium samsonianum]